MVAWINEINKLTEVWFTQGLITFIISTLITRECQESCVTVNGFH